MRKHFFLFILVFALISVLILNFGLIKTIKGTSSNEDVKFVVVDTGQTICYSNAVEFSCSHQGESFYGQDAQYNGVQPAYLDNGDETVTDLNTGLMWQQDPDSKMTWEEAVSGAESFNLAGYTDWWLPSIKELYSLILFSGIDPSGYDSAETSGLTPFIDTNYFHFEYGDTSAGERIIDSQYISSTEYVGETMGGHTVFGVNFADGRIKGYGTGPMPGQTKDKEFFVLYVRGNTDYGSNNFVNNGDGTIIDSTTGLMWMQDDSGFFNTGDNGALNWEQALEWAENLEYAGYSDWRLPNAKELQSIVDYTRSPATTSSAAIDPIFKYTSIIDEGGETNYPFYWTGTTHANWLAGGGNAAYITFGEALGYMEMPPHSGNYQLLDVHGAGAQRSDPKEGNPADYPYGHGPQGDVIRIYNYVRCVRGGLEVSGTPEILQIENLSQESMGKINLLISHANPSNDHYIDKVEIDLDGRIMQFTLQPHDTNPFTVELDLGEIQNTTNIKARAHCNVYGWGSWSNQIDIPEFPMPLIMVLAVLTVSLFMMRNHSRTHRVKYKL